MRRLLKIVLWLLGTLLGLLLLVALLAPLLVDPEDYKEQIAAYAQAKTGRAVRLEGHIRFSVLPWLGLNLGRVALGNAKGFGDGDFALVENAQIRLKLWPLLGKKVEMDTLVLEGLVLDLVRRADGTGNWDDLVALAGSGEQPAPAGDPLDSLRIEGVDIRRAELRWQDQGSGADYRLSEVNLRVGTLAAERPVPLELICAFELAGGESPLQGHAGLRAQLHLDLPRQRYRLSGVEMDLDLPSAPGPVGLKGQDIALDWAAHSLALNGLQLAVAGVNANLQAQVEDLAQRPAFSGSLEIVEVNVQDWLARLQLPSFTLPGPAPYNLAGFATRFQGELGGAVRLDEARLTVDRNYLDIPRLALDLAKQNLEVPQLALRLFGVDLRAQLQATDLFGDPRISGELSSTPFDAQALAQNLGLPSWPLPKPELFAQTSVQTKLTGRPSSGLALQDLQIEAGPNRLKVAKIELRPQARHLETGQITLAALGAALEGEFQADWQEHLTYSGRVKAAPFNLAEVFEQLALPLPRTADSRVFRQVGLRTEFKGTADSLLLEKLEARLDDTTLHGQLSVAGPGKPSIRFEAQADSLDLDRYLPPADTAQAQAPPSPATPAAELPLAKLRELDLQGTLHIKRLQAAKLKLEDVKLNVGAKDGVLEIQPANARLYQGNYTGHITLDTRGTFPLLSLDEQLQAIQLGPLLDDLQNGQGRLRGTGNVNARLSADASDGARLKKTLNGEIALKVGDGAYQGVNLAQALRETRALLKGEPLPPDTAPRSTDFTALDASFAVYDGGLHNRDLSLVSPLLRVRGQGRLDMVNEDIDYRLDVAVVETSTGQAGKDLAELRGLVVPVTLRGKLANPALEVDTQALLESNAERTLGRQAERWAERLRKQFGKLWQ